jgi:transcription antitermination factor NusG
MVPWDSEGEATSGLQNLELTLSTEQLNVPRWYAVHTRARHEKKVTAELQRRGVNAFLPAAREVRRWSDRRQVIESPLFPCYVFVHTSLVFAPRMTVLQTAGVFRFVGFNHGPVPIPDVQIEAVQSVLANHLPVCACGFIKVGERVRIRGGALDGLEGVLVGRNGQRSLIISIDLIQKSMAVKVEGYDIERV